MIHGNFAGEGEKKQETGFVMTQNVVAKLGFFNSPVLRTRLFR